LHTLGVETAELVATLDKMSAKAWRKKKAAIAAEAAKTRQTLLQSIQAKGEDMIPTIVVPANPQACVNLLNAKALLVDGRFEVPNPGQWMKRERELIVQKKIGSDTITFRVVDSTNRFKTRDWQSCVAVLADGKEWQFKGWPFLQYSNLFNSLAGCYIAMDDTPPNEFMATLNVSPLFLKRNSRHEDKALSRKIWKVIGDFINTQRPRQFSNSHKLPPKHA